MVCCLTALAPPPIFAPPFLAAAMVIRASETTALLVKALPMNEGAKALTLARAERETIALKQRILDIIDCGTWSREGDRIDHRFS